MDKKTITLLIPVFNEEQCLEITVQAAVAILTATKRTFEIIIINDGSTDATAQILQQLQKNVSIKVVTHKVNKGNGAAICSGIKAAKYKILATVDADGTYPLEALPRLLDTFDTMQADMVVGKRAKENDETSVIHRTAASLLNVFGSICTWHHIPDINSGLRVFKKELAMRYMHLYPQTFSFHIVLTISSIFDNARILYSNIDYFPRIGTSKLSAGVRGPLYFGKFIGLIIWLTCKNRPLRSVVGCIGVVGALYLVCRG